MIYGLVQHGRSTHFNPDFVMATAAYDYGLFSLEAWTCEAPRFISSFQYYDFGKQCVGERASRGLSVVVWISSVAVLGFLIWDINTTQVLIVKKKQKTKDDWEDEGWY